ncbi:hypothetical protein A2967_01425 [Candidatus Daviesbacteria bacterium RIFCSPLOWO2_01_FULL_41_32]|nr:MAG: hypothetical protein A2871_00940 [Candidatus Daviesbacteria bacterium RIFCSPHIGHO2_01_FULL_41_23]OGE62460.1 MAG: hypothetical protein A2967_01425 [Candidatus Daviesbacteria bacterium RIFCSPLOWO2_01_FULL_41_32]
MLLMIQGLQLPHPKKMKKTARGFTLIELLVVIAIMALVSVVTISNYSSFGQDQKLKSGVLDIQSLLRQAQTNAIANAKCSGSYTAFWQVDFAGDGKSLTLKCTLPSSSATTLKTLQLDQNIEMQSTTSGTGTGCATGLTFPFTVNFSLLKGNISFEPISVGQNCTSLTITLKNTKTNNTKTITIEQGGRVYEPVPTPSP